MFFKALSLAAACLLLLPSSAFAKDLRAFANPGCVNAFFVCLAIPAGGCCSSPGSAFASYRLSDGSGVARTIGYSNSGCTGSQSITLGGGSCAGASFAMFSARWIASGSLVARVPSSTACEEAKGFGYVDEEGNVFEGVIPEEGKQDVIDAVNSNDGEAIKAFAKAWPLVRDAE